MTFFTLQHSMRWTFLFHALCGAVALLIFLVPIFSKKGGKLHTRSGWIYTGAMALVCASAFIITPWRMIFDPHRTHESQGAAAFLFFIAAFTACTLYFGLVVLKNKQRTAPSKDPRHIAPPIALVALSIGTIALGIKLGSSLLVTFPALALLSAKGQLNYWRTSPTTRRQWWYAHMSGMSVACIATVTAFLVTALPRIFYASWSTSPVLWIAPGVVGGFLLKKFTARYEIQFGDVKRAGAA